jgi:potassium channel subfamily K, other eukaryote
VDIALPANLLPKLRDWWIASTAIPLIAATAGPLANVMSIVALVSTWRDTILADTTGPDDGHIEIGVADPHWYV